MKQISLLIIVCFLVALNSSTQAQSSSTNSTTISKTMSTVTTNIVKLSESELLKQAAETKKWEDEQIANGVPYVILENGQKAFYASTPKENENIKNTDTKQSTKLEDNNKTKESPKK
jgi:hypothetical protein